MTDAQLDEIYDAAYGDVMQNHRSHAAHDAGLRAVATAAEAETRRLIGADLRNGSYDAYPHFGCEDAIAEWIDPKETTDD